MARNYSYQAVDGTGESVSGEITAGSVASALQALEQRGLSIRSITEIDDRAAQPFETHSAKSSIPELSKPVGRTSALCQRIEAALERRETVVPALMALADEMPASSVQGAIRKLVDKLQRGTTTAELIEDRVSATWLPVLVSGLTKESSAKRIRILVADAVREVERRNQRLRALAYPLVLSLFVLFVLGSLCAFLVPTFQNMFTDFGLRLPKPTQFLFWCTEQLYFHPLRTFLVIFFLVAIYYAVARFWTRSALPSRFLGFLYAGNSSSLRGMASFTHSLVELLDIDATLPEALRIAGRNCQHPHIESVARSLAEQLEQRTQPLGQFSMLHSLPPTLVYALRLGPEGTPSIPLLRELSAVYSDRVGGRSEGAGGATAPLAIFAIGVLVAFVVISLFMPLVSMISALS